MNREEAIEVLKGFTTNPLFSPIHCEALKLAIEYLQKEDVLINKLNEENIRLKNENFNLRGVISNVKMILKMRGIVIEGFWEGE